MTRRQEILLALFLIAEVTGITNDYAGNPRAATGPWDIGAFVATNGIGGGGNIQPQPGAMTAIHF